MNRLAEQSLEPTATEVAALFAQSAATTKDTNKDRSNGKSKPVCHAAADVTEAALMWTPSENFKH